eukprot:GFKZ01000163.1.p1 GENE.GFKZ01000163.1~~GFKZ01000163.1.p1  ORF type:complete len:131 (-),score=42.66 GFKZ01000163.1:1089-1481(-)
MSGGEESKKDGGQGEQLVSIFQILDMVGQALQQMQEGAEEGAIRRSMSVIQERLSKCDGVLDGLAGGGMTREDQVKEIERLGAELKRKRELVGRYAEQDIVRRVLAQRAIPEQDFDKADENEDVLMGLDI